MVKFLPAECDMSECINKAAGVGVSEDCWEGKWEEGGGGWVPPDCWGRKVRICNNRKRWWTAANC